jgi:type VI secretion system protein ImpC
MPHSTKDGHLRVDLSFQSDRDPIPGPDEDFFPIAILGDFSGRTARPENASITPASSVRINCDNFESVFGKFEVTLRLKAAKYEPEDATIQFDRLEDFHPDRLIHRIAPLSRLFDLRTRLLDPVQAEAVVAEARTILIRRVPTTDTTPLPPTPTESTQDLLQRLLGKSAAPKPESAPAASTVERLIKKIVMPHVVPSTTTEQSDLVKQVEDELSVGLREVLHDPDFQALEAVWRGIDFLVREISDQIALYLIDISKAELAAQITTGDLAKTPISKRLEQIHPAVVLGMFTFGPGDQPLLGSLGSLMQTLRTSFVAGASPQMVGSSSFGLQADPDDWTPVLHEFEALRRMPESSHLGLFAPRFLLRQPYGPDSDPIEAFDFQEVLAHSEHESYLWGNPSVLCGYLLADADAFATEGWDLDTCVGGQVFGLPVHTLATGGDTEAKPCAEAWLSDRAADIILDHGIMPVLSIRGRDAVEIRALHSFATPRGPLIIRSE